ncbi:BglG family transcription antiterminator [Vagococcus xieshaowenii]|uniref:BglG family transcription antiterminator n=1 Tax=Vagococcus xieshaowenii TaxID=2562451 RepID=UPI00143273C5|nr:BglG family transcription antiterminator [Vagococcus xieshaowenii]
MLLSREKKILDYLLLNREEIITTTKLAEIVGCSERTIKTSIKLINDTFEGEPFKIQTKTGKGMWLKCDEKDLDKLMSYIQEPILDSLTISLITILLKSSEPISIKVLADKTYSSSSAVHRELIEVEDYLKGFDIQLMKELRKGISLKGKEESKRNLMVYLTKKKIQKQNQTNYLIQIQQTIPNIEIKSVQACLDDTIKEYKLLLSDNTYYDVLIYTMVALLRMKEKQLVQIDDKEIHKLKETHDWKVADSYTKKLENKFSVTLPIAEIAFFTIHFLSAKASKVSLNEHELNQYFVDEVLDAQLLEWLKEIESHYSYNLHEDKYFIKSLLMHLKPLLNRAYYGITISNPWLEQMKSVYGESFEMAIELVVKIETAYGYKIKEEDIAYIAMHIEAAITRLEQLKYKKKKLLIVCASGIGMSNFIKAKVEQLFGNYIEVLDTVSSVGTDFDSYASDLIITTVPLEVNGKKVIQVSPLLNQMEQKNIMNALDISKQSQSVLSQFVTTELIETKINAKTVEEAIKAAVTLLENSQCVTEDFYEKVIEREDISPTAIGNKIAIPHASNDAIKKEGIVCITLNKPIKWGKESVQIVFLLALSTKSKNQFTDIFSELLTISQDSKKIKKIIDAQSAEIIESILA